MTATGMNPMKRGKPCFQEDSFRTDRLTMEQCKMAAHVEAALLDFHYKAMTMATKYGKASVKKIAMKLVKKMMAKWMKILLMTATLDLQV